MEQATNIGSGKSDEHDTSNNDVMMEEGGDVINTPIKNRTSLDVGGGTTPITSMANQFLKTNLASGGSKSMEKIFFNKQKNVKSKQMKNLLGLGAGMSMPAVASNDENQEQQQEQDEEDNNNSENELLDFELDEDTPSKQQPSLHDTPKVGKIRRCTTLVEGGRQLSLFSQTSLDDDDEEVADFTQQLQHSGGSDFQRFGSTSTNSVETQIKQHSGATKRKNTTEQQHPQPHKRQQAIRPDTAPGMLNRFDGFGVCGHKLQSIEEDNTLAVHLEEYDDDDEGLVNFDAGSDRHVRNLVAPKPSTPLKVQEAKQKRLFTTSKQNVFQETTNVDEEMMTTFDDNNGASPVFTAKQKIPAITRKSPGNKWQRSATDTAAVKLTLDGGLTGDYSMTPQLPLHPDSTAEMNYISDETLVKLLSGELTAKYEIVDCRFPYEYEGGHIKGAINGWTFEIMKNRYFEKNPLWATTSVGEPPVVVIFYCEFSSKRAPTMYRSIRAYDRTQNQYPHLHYPEIYVLRGGYKNFYANEEWNSATESNELVPKLHNLEWCNTPTYLPMHHEDYLTQLCECEKERKNKAMKKGKKAGRPKFDGHQQRGGRIGRKSRMAMCKDGEKLGGGGGLF